MFCWSRYLMICLWDGQRARDDYVTYLRDTTKGQEEDVELEDVQALCTRLAMRGGVCSLHLSLLGIVDWRGDLYVVLFKREHDARDLFRMRERVAGFPPAYYTCFTL